MHVDVVCYTVYPPGLGTELNGEESDGVMCEFSTESYGDFAHAASQTEPAQILGDASQDAHA